MTCPVETLTVGPLTVHMELDPEPLDASDGDCFCHLVLFGEARSYGDQHGYRSEDYTGWGDMQEALERANPGAIVRPVYLMDHSGIYLSTDAERFRMWDPQAWDWCQVGFAVASADDMRRTFLLRRLTAELRERAGELVDAEVELRSQVLQGEVYAYFVRAASGEVLDSCGGLIGYDHAVTEARAAAEALQV
jgi:hypothetical protein